MIISGVTICCVDGISDDVKNLQSINAIIESIENIDFESKIFISPKLNSGLEKLLKDNQITHIEIEKKDYCQYNEFLLKYLTNYIKTNHVLIVQSDGYVVNPDMWDYNFLNFDYIGAPWPLRRQIIDGVDIRVGNGGFSLRSKKLLDIFNIHEIDTKDPNGLCHEDVIICVHKRKELQDKGIKFAEVDVASKFSREIWCHDSVEKPFGFHLLKP